MRKLSKENIAAITSSRVSGESPTPEKPFMMNFIERQQPVREPEYNDLTQLHNLEGRSRENIASFTTTAIPNHRDTV